MNKKEEVMNYLYDKIFCNVINSKTASKKAKSIVNKSIMCLKELPLESMILYVWNAVYEEDNNGNKANSILKKEGFVTFQDIIEEFKEKFNDDFIKNNLI